MIQRRGKGVPSFSTCAKRVTRQHVLVSSAVIRVTRRMTTSWRRAKDGTAECVWQEVPVEDGGRDRLMVLAQSQRWTFHRQIAMPGTGTVASAEEPLTRNNISGQKKKSPTKPRLIGITSDICMFSSFGFQWGRSVQFE